MCPRVYVRACPYEQELQEAPVDTERETLLADKTKDTRCVACMRVCMVVPVFGSAVLVRLHLLLSALFLTLEFCIAYHRCGSQAETPLLFRFFSWAPVSLFCRSLGQAARLGGEGGARAQGQRVEQGANSIPAFSRRSDACPRTKGQTG